MFGRTWRLSIRGVEVPIVPHFAATAGYRYSRVSADTPLNAHSVTFGVGYRF